MKKERNPERAKLVRRACAIFLVCATVDSLLRGFGGGRPTIWIPVLSVNVVLWLVGMAYVYRSRKLPSRVE